MMSIRRIAAWKKRQPQILVTLLSYKTSTRNVRCYFHRRRIVQLRYRRDRRLLAPFLGLNVLG